jgi:DNA sulfur modification protein DndD
MVTFNRLTMRNFKRFSGEHHICLSGDGRVTVVAAENGLGKTTMMDAIHVALYGKRGFRYLYPQKNFNQWIVNAHSVDADQSGSIVLAIEMEDPVLGIIRLSRSYWILDATKHDIEEEVGITVAGKPLEKESGETRSGLAERWIEDYLPHAAMRRFLVDGERLSHLDPRQIDIEIVQGIDDATGIGLLHRLKRHLDSVKKQTLKTLAPEDQEKSVSHLLKLLESVIEDRKAAQLALDDCVQKVEADGLRIIEIQNDIESLTQDGGSENVQLRMDYAICQSKVTSSRQFVHEHLMESLPFVVAGLPDNLSEWMIDETLAAHRSTKRVDEHRTFLESILEESQVGKITRGRLERSSERILESMSISSSEDTLSHLPLEALESLIQRHAELGMVDAKDRVSTCVLDAIQKLDAFEESENKLRQATAGSGIAEKAEELKELARGLGVYQAETARLKGEVTRHTQSRLDIEKRIGEIRQRENSDSLLNRRLTRIDQLQELTALVTSSVRASFAEPLADSFSEGFELLSRKSGRLEKVRINIEDYSIHLTMRGFEGNWLDRDLSATEKQHVGLALIYALRRASTQWSLPLPVVVDTPTSRMDSVHKSWSVTRFYPQLSNQVIVFATSDDLAGGLFSELEESGVLGPQLLVQEVSDNSVEVVEANLDAFFGG